MDWSTLVPKILGGNKSSDDKAPPKPKRYEPKQAEKNPTNAGAQAERQYISNEEKRRQADEALKY